MPRRARSLRVEVVHAAGDWSGIADAGDLVEAAVAAVGARLPATSAAALCIALSDDDEVRALNRSYRGKDSPTNVLSFPAPASVMAAGGEPRHLGDVVLALGTLMAEARALAIAPAAHLQHLTVHGVLHLLGHDHIEPAAAEAMEALEVEILASLGVADPYCGPPLAVGGH